MCPSVCVCISPAMVLTPQLTVEPVGAVALEDMRSEREEKGRSGE